MPPKSYGFAIGNLRARENSLLKSADMTQLMSANSTDELAAMLRDKGFGDPSVQGDVPEMLRAENAKLWSYLLELAPEVSAFEPFMYENDFHNLKVILKGIVRNREYVSLLLTPASVEVSLIETAVREKRFDLLPPFMRQSAAEGYEIMTQNGDAQLADAVIDTACMTAQLDAAEKTRNRIIKNIISASVFYNNMKTAFRAAKTGKSASFLNDALTENGVVAKSELINAALGGEEKLLELLSSAVSVSGAAAAECYKKSAGEFEKFGEDYVMSAARSCKYVTLGVEPMIGYLLARRCEIKDVRIIYSGIKTGQPEEEIRERLRELYG